MHALPQTDFPWVIQESFGTHGLSGTGLSLEWLMPKLWADANELVVEVMNGNNEVAFAGSDWRKPTFLVNLKSYWDLSANTYLQFDLTGLHGVTDHDGNLDHDFLALDLVYDWYPLGRELYRGFQLRGMLLRSWLSLVSSMVKQATCQRRICPTPRKCLRSGWVAAPAGGIVQVLSGLRSRLSLPTSNPAPPEHDSAPRARCWPIARQSRQPAGSA